jgi:preprotein translocase subunit YajC
VRKVLITASFAALAALAGPASAQPAQAAAQPANSGAAANWAAGVKISDTAGGEVGTIASVDGEFIILKTDKHEVRLPKTSFTAHNGGFIMSMTRAQVNAEVEKALASANEKIAPGAEVSGSQGGKVGTIDSADAEFVTVKLTSGKLVRLPRSGVAPGPNGAVVGLTVAELEAAASAAGSTTAAEADESE